MSWTPHYFDLRLNRDIVLDDPHLNNRWDSYRIPETRFAAHARRRSRQLAKAAPTAGDIATMQRLGASAVLHFEELARLPRVRLICHHGPTCIGSERPTPKSAPHKQRTYQ